jgi:tetratricopeptide (TPR) repeat protein
MLDSHASALPSMSVDVLASTSGDVTVRWTQAPGHHARDIPAEERARIDVLAEAVRAAESQRPCDPVAIARTRQELGRALYAMLDGPERALTRRCQDAAGRDGAAALAIRLGSIDKDKPVDSARHPAVHWRWELLADERGPLTTGPGGLAVAVQLGDRGPAAPRTFELGGLRILFMAFSPNDTQPELDYEREEEHVLGAVAEFVRDGRARLRVVEHGSLDELKRCLLGRPYDVVHLSGHGVLTPEGPRLLMEDEVGDRHPVSPDELLHMLRRAGRMPEVVMISTCFSAGSRDGTPSLAAQLVAGGVPTVIGWVQPVRDDLATEAAADIYQRVCTGATPAEAVAFARRQLFDADQRAASLAQRSHTWGTLHLLTCDASDIRLDEAQPALTDEPADVNEAYTYLNEGRMRVLARGFIGRRRPLQRLIRILVRGADQGVHCAGAIILGMKGVGKSCLAGRAIQRVSQELDDPGQLGLVVVHGALDELNVLEQFEAQTLRWNDKQAETILKDASEPLLRRLRRLLAHHWKRRRLVLVLDDFEQNLDIRPEGHALLKPQAAALLEVLVPACRTAQAKLLVTTTASFELNERDQASLPVIRLGPFERSSIRKMWLRGQNDGGGPGSPGAGSLGTLAGFSSSTWNTLCDRLGRNPRILDWARTLIAGKSHDEVESIVRAAGEELAAWRAGAVPSAEEQNELARLFLRHMAYGPALAMVSPDARTFVKRARVYEVAAPARAFTALTEGLDVNLEKHLPAWRNVGLLEAGELDGESAYRVSPLVEPTLDVLDAERWHAAAAGFWEDDSKRHPRLDRVQMAWAHALAGKCQAIADRTGRRIDAWLNSAGLYRESLQLAEQHVRAFPDSAIGHVWAGYAAHRAGSPQRGWEYHARAELLATRDGVEELERAGLLREGAEILRALGRLEGARSRLEQAIRIEQETQAGDTHELAASLHALAGVLQAQGDLAGARQCLERSLAIQTKVFGTDEHPSVAASLHELAGVLRAQGDLAGARQRLERALAIDIKRFGTDEYPEVAASLHALAGVLHAQGDLAGARQRLERALAIKTKRFGTDEHPSVAASLHELAGVLHAQGDLAGARQRLERALAIETKVFGTDEHPSVAASLHALAGVLHAQGDLAGARQRLERALAIETKVFGTDEHPSVAASLHALAGVLHAQGDLVGARQRLERALAIETKVFGTDEHPSVATSLHALAGVLHAQGDLVGARQRLERAFAIQSKLFGIEHPEVAASLHALAGVLHAQGDLVGARQRLEHSLAIDIRLFGTDEHPSVAASLHALADVLHAQGDLAGARQRLERALAIQSKLFGTDEHPSVAASLHALAGVLHAQGDLVGARQRLERALAIDIKLFGTDEHPEVAASLHELARVLRAEGDPQGAIELLWRVLQIEAKCYGTLHQYHSAETEVSLGFLLLQEGDAKQGLSVLVHAARIFMDHAPGHPLLAKIMQFLGPADDAG